MKFYFFQIFLVKILTVLANQNLSPDTKKFYHDIGSGRGLYASFDKVVVLNITTFNDTVFNSPRPKTWVIEFYNSWCGHCHRFAPTWKSLASDVLGWQDVIGIGAVDCSNNYNTPLCREYEIMYYPLIKYFPAKSSPGFLGTPIQQNSVENLKFTIIDALKEELKIPDSAPDRPKLLPYEGSTVRGLWANIPDEVLYTILVIEDDESYTGAELALDLFSVEVIQVRLGLNTNKELMQRFKVTDIPAVFLCERANIVREIIPEVRNRTSFYYALKDVFKHKGITLSDLEFRTVEEYQNADVQTILEMMQIDQKIKEKLNLNDLDDSVSFQTDLESALRYSFYNEISSKKMITGEALVALKLYLKVLSKHFPIGKHGVKYLHHIKDELNNRTRISGQKFDEIAKKYEKQFQPVFLSNGINWLGCRGSQPNFRGFPCSLWMVFHTLTVYAESNAYTNESPHEVLTAMAGYVKHFFGCTNCAEHFLKIAQTFPGNVTNHDEAILWLWAAHNAANKRLALDASADPKHPKIQFPSIKTCSYCRVEDSHSWDEEQVLSFLKAMYRNISYLVLEDLTVDNNSPLVSKAPAKRDTSSLSQGGESLGNFVRIVDRVAADSSNSSDFNIFDVSLCVVLYLCSMIIVLVGFFKFCFKYRKGHKRKNLLFEFFNKV